MFGLLPSWMIMIVENIKRKFNTIFSVIINLILKLIPPSMGLDDLMIVFLSTLVTLEIVFIRTIVYYFLLHNIFPYVLTMLESPLVWITCRFTYLTYDIISSKLFNYIHPYVMTQSRGRGIELPQWLLDTPSSQPQETHIFHHDVQSQVTNNPLRDLFVNELSYDVEAHPINRQSEPVFGCPISVVHEDPTCSICISDVYEDMLEISNCMLCHKTFHKNCITSMVNSKCPNCRGQTIFHDVKRIEIIDEEKSITSEHKDTSLNEEKSYVSESLDDLDSFQQIFPNQSVNNKPDKLTKKIMRILTSDV